MLRSSPLRLLDDRDTPALLALLDQDPVANCFVTSRIEAVGLEPRRLGAEMWGYVSGGRLTAACYAGANLVPTPASPEAIAAFADRARRQGRRCSSIVGPAQSVGPLWRALEPAFGRARSVRTVQPLMATSAPAPIAADPAVRLVEPHELDLLMPACIAMFTEEVGISPTVGDGGFAYRARVAELIGAGRALARIDNGRVVFKAELGAVSHAAAQVQGVWVDPAYRGQRLAAPGMAAVVNFALATVAPRVSLYVNDFNTAAHRAYVRAGFTDVGTFSSILF